MSSIPLTQLADPALNAIYSNMGTCGMICQSPTERGALVVALQFCLSLFIPSENHCDTCLTADMRDLLVQMRSQSFFAVDLGPVCDQLLQDQKISDIAGLGDATALCKLLVNVTGIAKISSSFEDGTTVGKAVPPPARSGDALPAMY
eukprot:gene15989-1986_t